MKGKIIIFDGIESSIIYKRVKNIRIKINSCGVSIIVPYGTKDKYVEKVLVNKIHLIKKHLIKIENRKKYDTDIIKNGELIYLWDKEYNLLIQKSDKNRYDINGNNICLYLKDIEKKEKLLEKLYRAEMEKEAFFYIEKWKKLTEISIDEWHIKKMKTRWGSCNIIDRRIWLNLNLAKHDKKCLEYVVLHEIMHIQEKNHNKRFYSLIEHYMPEWKEAKALLV